YDKIHMFDVDLDNGESWRESNVYKPGDQSRVIDVSGVKFGLSICYDLRFPQLYREQALAGAQILTVPAAFTRQTGKAHWHILLRARAIENGAFVIAAAQGGDHDDGRETFGHSLIINPWGDIIAECDSDETGFVVAELDLDEVGKARTKIPNLANMREFELAFGERNDAQCVEAAE
ncbi:MAG: nitrilase-related carbon-nitrogen hydrolase, partial [Pseudomonadota bacterium]